MFSVKKSRFAMAASLAIFVAGLAWAAVSTIPASNLIPSTGLYTDTIGGGIGAVILDRNDDESTAAIDLGFTLNFFGNDYTQFYINNNGNVTFQSPLWQYVPSGPQGTTVPVISLWFADVDTRNLASGVVHLRNDIANQLIVTWDHVGKYSYGSIPNTFQLVLRGPGYTVPSGQGRVGFFYTGMQWDAAAAAGFGDGQTNGVTIQGSLASSGFASTLQNHHIWFDLTGGIPTATPPSQTSVPALGTMGLIILAAALFGAASLWLRRRESHAV